VTIVTGPAQTAAPRSSRLVCHFLGTHPPKSFHAALGDPLHTPVVTERRLRSLLRRKPESQLRAVQVLAHPNDLLANVAYSFEKRALG
jgi:hypothetical protein